MALRSDCVVQENAHDQRQTDSNRKGYSQSSDVNGCNQKEVGHIEDSPTGNSEQDVSRVCMADITEKGKIASTPIPQREAPTKASEDNPNHVIPVIKLEGISWSEFHGVRPRSPAQHAEDHEQQRNSVSFWLIHASPG